MSAAVLFSNATLVDGRVAEPRPGFHLLVEDDRIKEISDRPITSSQENLRKIDLAGATLMPGLIDAHVHVKATVMSLGSLNNIPSTYLFAGAANIMEEMLMRGFTTVRDAAGADRGLADAVDHGLMVGPRLFVSGLALSQTGGHADFRPATESAAVITCACQVNSQQLGRIADGVDECRRAARDELRKGAHQLKIMAGGGLRPLQTQSRTRNIRSKRSPRLLTSAKRGTPMHWLTPIPPQRFNGSSSAASAQLSMAI